MQNLNTGNFNIAAGLSFFIAGIIFFFSFLTGKDELFLLLNTNAGKAGDYFFAAFTFGGDGIIWIPVLLIVVFVLKRKDLLPLIISAFAISTLIVQGIKSIVFPEVERPTKAIADSSLIHAVSGIDVHTIGSFPSGHTATAFCIYFIFCLLLPKKWWIWVGLMYALNVGYSRVYLAQHFPLDVAGGIIAAIIAVYCSVKIQQRWMKRNNG